MAECREHQRLRAELPDAERRVTVQEIVMAGGGVHATVRGASGYPIGVTLSRRRATWRLDGFGVTAVPRGEGSEVAPAGSLYAYRIPPGFISGGTAIGAVQATGAAFSTSVILPDRRSAEGVAIAQGAFAFRIHDRAALRSAIPRLDRAVRESSLARGIDRPVAEEIGGRPAVSWGLGRVNSGPPGTDGRTVFVFSSAANVVIVNCRWPRAGSDQPVLRSGCKAVLATLSVG